MKLYYATGSSSLYPHIVLHESGLAFEAIKIDEHATEIARSRAAAGNAASAQDRSESEAAGCRMELPLSDRTPWRHDWVVVIWVGGSLLHQMVRLPG